MRQRDEKYPYLVSTYDIEDLPWFIAPLKPTALQEHGVREPNAQAHAPESRLSAAARKSQTGRIAPQQSTKKKKAVA